MKTAQATHKRIATLPRDQKRIDHQQFVTTWEINGREILHDPIRFAEHMGIDRSGQPFMEVFCSPPGVVQEQLELWTHVLELIADRESKDEIRNALGWFGDFVTGYWAEGLEQGRVIGVVTEQYRQGLLEILKRKDREFSEYDLSNVETLANLCDKLGLCTTSGESALEPETVAAD